MKLARPILTHAQKQDHYGQVVPMEDVERIFEMVKGVVRLPCVCRRVTTGNMNARYCYGLTMDKQLMEALDDSFSLELLTKEEALESIRKLDKEGLVHSVWTFKTPFIGGLCNCDQDCMAYRITHVAQGLSRHVPRGMGGRGLYGGMQWLPSVHASMPVWGNPLFLQQQKSDH